MSYWNDNCKANKTNKKMQFSVYIPRYKEEKTEKNNKGSAMSILIKKGQNDIGDNFVH